MNKPNNIKVCLLLTHFNIENTTNKLRRQTKLALEIFHKGYTGELLFILETVLVLQYTLGIYRYKKMQYKSTKLRKVSDRKPIVNSQFIFNMQHVGTRRNQ